MTIKITAQKTIIPTTNVVATPQNQCSDSWIWELRFIPNIPAIIAPTAAVDVTMDTANSIWSKRFRAESSRNITFVDIKCAATEKVRYAKYEESVARNNISGTTDWTHTQNIGANYSANFTEGFVRFDFRLLKSGLVEDGRYFLQIGLQEKFNLIVIVPVCVYTWLKIAMYNLLALLHYTTRHGDRHSQGFAHTHMTYKKDQVRRTHVAFLVTVTLHGGGGNSHI